MAQRFCGKIFIISLSLASYFALVIESSALPSQKKHPPSSVISGSFVEGFPTGCKFYLDRKLLQCRNAQLQTIPKLKEKWNIEIVSDLSGNNISTINFGDGYKSVKIVHLDQNNITSIAEDLSIQLQHFQFISLGGNPFNCDCKIEWLSEKLRGINKNFPQLMRADWLKCVLPISLQGKSIVNITREELCGSEATVTLQNTTTTSATTTTHRKSTVRAIAKTLAGSEATVTLQNTTTTSTTTTTHRKSTVEATAKSKLVKPTSGRIATAPRSLGKKTKLTAEARPANAQKGRVAEIIGVTSGFAAIIIIMSIAFVVM